MRSRSWFPAAALAALFASVPGPALGAGPFPAGLQPAPVSPASLVVYHDTFNTSSTYASYQPLGGGTVAIAGGRLVVSVPDATVPGGLRFRLPRGGRGVRCAAFRGLEVASGPIGSYVKWTWYGFDDTTGQEVEVMETTIEKTGSFTVRHQKKNGTTVSVHIPGKDWKDVKSKRWDTRRSGRQVQLEIEWKDGTSYRSDWMDPPASTIAGFDVETDLPELSIDDAEGAEVHMETVVVDAEPLEPFDPRAPKAAPLHWLLQGKDADRVVAATIVRVGELGPPLGEDRGRRLAVEYRLDERLMGGFVADRFTVSHLVTGKKPPRQLVPGRSFLLFLQEGGDAAPAGALWDFGRPAGVIPDSPQNRRAVVDRLELLYGGPSDENPEGE